MQLLQVTGFYLLAQVSTLFIGVYGQCSWKNGSLPSIRNGYRSNVDNLKLYSNGSAFGYYDMGCELGYTLDTNIGGRITCLSTGSWSQPLPQCKSMGSCSISILFTFIQNAEGIRTNRSLNFIYTNGVDDNQALGGSNITVQCANQYKNVGGSLTIVCTQNNNWTTFPNCVSTSTSTTVVTPVRCSVKEDTWIFTNGYMSNTSGATAYDDNTANGFVVVSCSSGYVMDSVSGGIYACKNGTWSLRPYCTKTARCSLPQLKQFLNDSSATKGLDISSQRLLSNTGNKDEILVDSYILFTCNDGYKNIDNNLKVTCQTNGQWSNFPNCVPLSTSTIVTTGRCPWKNGAWPIIPNGYESNVDNVKRYSDGFAEGYYDIACQSGYTRDTSIGGRITCLNTGSWSNPLPQCKSMGSCSIPILFTFIQNAEGIRTNRSLNFIYTNGVDDNQALGGSNITVQCANQYKNVGGSLTIVCTQNNNWTTFPNCVSTSTSTTVVTPVRCSTKDDTWIFTNGYMSNTSGATVYNDNTAIGFVVVSCSSGYVMDSVSGGIYACKSGTWSPRPYCTKTARCSLLLLKQFLNDSSAAKGLDISSQSLSTNSGNKNEILVNSYVLFTCNDGYKNVDNNLKVICQANGQWSSFPSCIPLDSTVTHGTSSVSPK